MAAIYNATLGYWVDSVTGQQVPAPGTPGGSISSAVGSVIGGGAPAAAGTAGPNPWGTGASMPALGPGGVGTTTGGGQYTPPPASQLSGAVGIPGTGGGGGAAAGSGGTQSSDMFGTGVYQPPPFPINQGAIAGNPVANAGGNYGLNDVWGNLSTAVQNLTPQNYAASAPSATAAQGTAAQAAAAQGAASGYSASTGNASGVTGPATMGAARSGYAIADPTRISTAGDLAWQNQQQGLANTLNTQANGGGVSPADLQLKQGMDQQVAAQLAVLGSQRGATDYGMAQRSAAQGAATSQAQLNQQMGIQRAQETIQAQQALGNVLGTARGQAQNYNVNQADLLQQLQLQNAANAQQSGLANANLSQGAAQFNASNAQQSNQFNASNSQQMQLQNLLARNTANQYNAGNAQGMTLADMLAQNNMTSQNLNAQNTMGLANLGNQQATSLANLGLAGQYGLANQQAQIASTGQYNQQLLGLLGAQTGIGQANRAAALAGQQLGVQQQLGLGQIGAQAYAADAQAKANLTGGVIGAGASLLSGLASGLLTQTVNAAGQTVYTNSQTGFTTSDPSSPGLFTDSPTDPNVGGNYGASATPTPVMGGDGTTGTTSSPLTSSSDENVKTGVQGGNPMLDSFLQQYKDFQAKTGKPINPDEGLGFRTQRYVSALSGGTPRKDSFTSANNAGGQFGGMAGGALGSLLGPIGGFIGGQIGKDVGNMAGGGDTTQSYMPSAGTAPTMRETMVGPATGTEQVNVDGETDPFALSDDREKEAVMSGNRGVQSFLEQANAQQNAQNQSGAQSNAFMQSGAPPNAQVDRQMVPPFVTAAGYGQSGPVGGPQFGGQSQDASVTGWGGWSPASEQNAGSFWGGGLSSMGGVTQGPGVSAGGMSAGTNAQQTAPPVLNPWANGANPTVTNNAATDPFANFNVPPPLESGIFQPGTETLSPLVTAPKGPSSPPGSGGPNDPATLLHPTSTSSVFGSANGTAPTPQQIAQNYSASPPPIDQQIASITSPTGQANINTALGPSGTGFPSADTLAASMTPDQQVGLITSPQGQANLNAGLSGGFDLSSVLPGGANYVPQAPPAWTNSLYATSDEKEKTDITNPSPDHLGELLDHLHAHQYRYKDPSAPGAGAGTYVSPMAQELEQTDLGKNFVYDGPDGHKMVDYGKMAGTQLAATSMLHERVSDLEELLKRSAAMQPQGSK